MDKAGSLTLPVQNDAYAYDALDNRIRKTANGVDQYAVFDAANQLVELRSGSPTGALTQAFVYDANGNLAKKCEGTGVTRTTTTCSGSTYSTFAWDPDDRLIQANMPGATETYQYDHLGRRISKTSNGVTTYYRYNGDDIDAEYSATWSETARYVHGPNTDDPLMRLTGNTGDPTATAIYYHQDGINSVVATSDQSGNIVAAQVFDAWGNKVQASGTIPTYGYTGREPDQTGLIYYRARYYDPALGRFISRDPAGMPDGVNRYAYVGGDPVNRTDPSGEDFITAGYGAIAGGISGFIASSDSLRSNASFRQKAPTIFAGTFSGAVAGGVVGFFTPAQSSTVGRIVGGAASALVGNIASTTIAQQVQNQRLKPLANLTPKNVALSFAGAGIGEASVRMAGGLVASTRALVGAKASSELPPLLNAIATGYASGAVESGLTHQTSMSSPPLVSDNSYLQSNSGSQNMASFAQLSAPQGPTLGSGNYSSGGHSILRSK